MVGSVVLSFQVFNILVPGHCPALQDSYQKYYERPVRHIRDFVGPVRTARISKTTIRKS